MKPNNDKKIYFRLLFLTWLIIGIFSSFKVQAQRDKEKLQGMIEEDRTTINAIAGYDENVQQDILQLAQTPEVLSILENLQKKSEKQFRDVIQDYDRDSQAALYEMARYPDLISDLVRNGKPSSSQVNSIVSRYPSDIHTTANKYARSCYDALRKIDQLNNEIDEEFQSYLTPYNEQTRASVRNLLKYPEIVSILVEDKEFTRLLGSVYLEDPEWVINQLDTISKELEEENQKDLADYRNQIQNDPEAAQEMLDAANKFAEETDLNREYNDYPAGGSLEISIIHSYPFWFGYPYWYPYPYWRPYPVYYHTGFYMGPNRHIVFVGLPSINFIYWQTHYHPTLYPHLSYSYYNYYHNHYLAYRNHNNRPIFHSGFYNSIERNVVNNPRVNNENLLRIDRQRGANIIRQPSSMSGNNNTYYSGRRSSVVTRTDNYKRGTVKRDAFPRTTPSLMRSSEGSYRRSPVNQNNSLNTRSGQYTAPSFNRGANQATPSQNEIRSRVNSEAGRQNNFQQRDNSQTNPLRNYRNFKATEPRQANTYSSGREPVQRMNSREGNRNQSNSQSNKTSGGFRKSREK